MAYYDIDAILLDDQIVPAHFNTAAMDLGVLDPSTPSPHIDQGTETDIPLWLALSLAKRSIVTLRSPSFFGESFQAHLLADAQVLNIHDKCPFFYELGVKLAKLTGNWALPAVLKKAFHTRYLRIVDTSINLGAADYSEHIRKLTTAERNLFHLGHAAAAEVLRYKTRDTDRLAASAVVTRKRRRAALGKK
ncbi:DNA replication complex GINS protein PSF3 [Thecamonas trahens ATCC 50062]|uniref:DNA replication complex GINS protein PSF3 n=1 Tax=Thecamonas trahens ATCC 50062 TaxID=461836 RepID=A0A0L0DJQ1_THETB|nr:DNA replication complex GINS protein PSF3 [Thecamonas trahens ATCC 50062]KNC52341.1 DNA replication complex GINS protein PSF3 [Thecamonas trahens ATCC 50062]|eukprot:XP_013755391.1 DNA replication complex GINS protein PSF3 [Thecamonas trahens ATCC 50062]